MNPRVVLPALAITLAACGGRATHATLQSQPSVAADTFDLAALHAAGGLRLVARDASAQEDEGRFLRLGDGTVPGMAWLDDAGFRAGTLEVELRGRDLRGASFVGLAFNGSDDETYEAVYLRPFNFFRDDPQAQRHMIQYIAHPQHTWSSLRQGHPGVYESRIASPPAADAWIRLRLEVTDTLVRAFVDDAPEPTLVVRRLVSPRPEGRVGLWVGNPSRGDFRWLRVVRR